MRRGAGALAIVALSLAVLGSAPAPTRGVLGEFQKGMVLGIFSKSDPEYFRSSLEELQSLGVNSICRIVPNVQKKGK